MKLLKLFIVLTFFISCKKKDPFIKAKAIKSEIDTLETQKDIENYIHKIDTIYKKFELKKIEDFDRGTEDSLNKILAKKVKMYDCFLKSDFDNNGLTDLLIIGDNHDCISFRPGIEGEKSCDYSTLVLMNYNNKINVSKTKRLEEAIISINCNQSSFKSNSFSIDHLFKKLKPPTTRRIKIFESANLELAYVAAGRLDAYINPDDKIWDMVAGSQLIKNAGGSFHIFEGDISNFGETTRGIVGTNEYLLEQILEKILQ